MNESTILEEKNPPFLNLSSFVGMRPSPNTYLEEVKFFPHVQNTVTPRAMLFGVRALTSPFLLFLFLSRRLIIPFSSINYRLGRHLITIILTLSPCEQGATSPHFTDGKQRGKPSVQVAKPSLRVPPS